MTQYFDEKAEELDRIQRILRKVGEGFDMGKFSQALDKLDYGISWDVSLCSEFEGFPEDLRKAVNETILKWSAAAQPVNGKREDYETPEEHITGVGNLISDLHTILHQVAERQIRGFGDDPRTPLWILYSRAEERREGLVGCTP